MLAPWPIGDKRTCRSDLCNNAIYEHRSFKQGPVGRGAGEGKFRYGRETLQEGLKKAFQHLQSNQKNYRREIHPAHGRENAPDRLQQRFGKAVDKPDSRIVIWELEPREYDRDENDQ